ncbi:MAG TPA: tetratricopeptide repeat protein [Kiritimatiellia bacterium]|nr:tetratricopeptide repeat protein [Kiritimatiellia bacterium]HRZ11674.1 tetratricopeptide repeat protein [Kiritimatiellia bacterium]HSA16775.1 tetratricopeptide repeat protein [Kiritimatiellia bacterium]
MKNAAVRWIHVPLLALAVFLVYGRTLDAPFLLDDNYSIVGNPALRRLWPLTAALNPPPVNMTFCTRPFIHLTMCADYARSGLAPLGYHRTNLLFHLAASLALFGLARRTLARAGVEEKASRALGLAIALLWAVHPLNTTAVNYLSQRGELGVGLFLFLTLYGLNRATERRSPGPAGSARAAGWLAAAVFFCLLGMGSKENMAAAPFLAMAYDRIFLGASWREVFRRRGFFHLALLLTLLWPVARILVYTPHVPKTGFDTDIYWRYPLTQAWGLARMLRLAAWPHPLIFDYGNQLVNHAGQVWIPLLFMAALAGLTAWALFRHPKLAFPALCFFALLAPSSSFFPVTGQPIAEHRLYAALAGPLALAALGVWRLTGRRAGLFLPVAGTWVVALGIAAGCRNSLYTNRVVLWSDTVAKRPASERAWNSLGQAFNDEGRHEEALKAYERALALEPTSLVHVNAGITLNSLGRSEEALRQYREALRLDPSNADAENRLGIALASLGRQEEAVEAQRRALALRPDHALAHLYLAESLAALGRLDEALPHYREAIRINPTLLEPHRGLAVALLAQGRTKEARSALLDGARLCGAPAQAYFDFSCALIDKGFAEEGLDMARRHLNLEPWHAVSLNNAAWILATSTNAALRDGEEAVQLARRAVDRSGKTVPAIWATLAAAQAEAGQFQDAVASAKQALELAREQGATNLAAPYEARLDIYRKGQPWRDNGN